MFTQKNPNTNKKQTCTQTCTQTKKFKVMTKKLKNQLVSIEQSWINKYANSKEITRVYSSDTAMQMAYKMFGGFGVGQSCAIVGVEPKRIGTDEERAACAAANAAGEDYESYDEDGNWILNCEIYVDKVDLVWEKLMNLCKRKGNTKKFARKQMGGIWNVYRIK